MEIITMGAITAFAFLILLWKLGIYKFLRFDSVTDLAVTAALTALFAGTMSGMMIAATAGIMVSIALYAMRKLSGVPQFSVKELFARG